MLLTAPRAAPIADIPALPEPEGWTTHYSTKSFEYRVNLAARACIHTHYLGEAVPNVSPDLGPNCLALYLGCEGVERQGTVWFEPCITDPEMARFRQPGDVHCHFFGTATLSHSAGIVAQPGDVFEISAVPFGRPLRNSLVRVEEGDDSITVKPL
jgi:hypothetical protein